MRKLNKRIGFLFLLMLATATLAVSVLRVVEAYHSQPDPVALAPMAQTLTVTKIEDTDDGVCGSADCSLREAIKRANQTPGADTIDFDPLIFNSAQTITLTRGLLQVTNPVSIAGPSGRLVVSGNNTTGVFNIAAGVTASISNLTISNGNTVNGGGIDNNGTLTISGVTLSGNTVSAGGGAIRNDGTLTVLNSTISGNSALTGGGIFNGQTLTVVNSTIVSNSSSFIGGGINNPNATAIVGNTIIAGNSGPPTGPDVAGTFTTLGHNFIGKSDGSAGFANNVMGDQVGTIASPIDPMLGQLADNGGPTFTYALLAGSTAIDAGDDAAATNAGLTTDQRGTGFPRLSGAHVDIGAFEAGTFTVTKTADTDDGMCDADCSLREAITAANANPDANTIDFSPSVFNTPQTIALVFGQLNITNPVTIIGPSGRLTLDAIQFSRGLNVHPGVTASISNLTVTRGVSSSAGGGLLNDGILTLNGVTFTNNTIASFSTSGAIFNTGTLTILNSTISGNRSFVHAGGIGNAGTLTVINCTITQNSAEGNGGGVYSSPSSTSTTVVNTIIAGNTVGPGQFGPDVSGSFISQGHNFIGRSDGSTGFTDGVNGDQVGTNAAPKNPMLGPLADNGGSTRTHALLAGSTAINAGDNTAAANAGVTTDQRGVARPFGPNVDIGAYEYNVPNNPPAGTDNTVTTAANTPYTFTAADFGFTDPNDNPPNAFQALRIGGPPSAGTLTKNNVPVVVGTIVSVTEINAGLLVFTPASAAFGSPYTTFTFQVQDNGGVSDGGIDLDQSPNTITINVIPPPPFTVTTTADTNDGVCDADCSLREAIAAANANPDVNVINFSPAFNAPQAITLTGGRLQVTNPVSIAGPSGRLVVSGNNTTGVFNIAAGVTASISNLTISNGNTENGGGIFNNGTLTISGVTLSGNTVSAGGGAIRNNGTLTVLNSTISGNSALTGGGIFNGQTNGQTLTVVNSTIVSNSSSIGIGGGINNANATAIVGNTIIAGNSGPPTSQDVAGFFTTLGHNFIGKSDGSAGFANNVMGDQVGTIASPIDPMLGQLADNGGPTFTYALLAGSTAIDAGDDAAATNAGLTTDQRGTGFPRLSGAQVDIGAFESVRFTVTNTNDTNDSMCDADCSLREAIAAANAIGDPNIIDFSALFTSPQTITLSIGELQITNPVTIPGPSGGLTINGNGASRVFNITGAGAVISNLTIAGGNAGDGGGIINFGVLALNGVTLSGNHASQNGGAIFNGGNGTLTILNSTLSGNSSIVSAGGLFNAGTAVLVNNTITQNTAGFGGGIATGLTAITVSNTIIAGNTGTSAPDVSGTFTSQGHNFIGNPDGSNGFTDGNNGDQVGTSAVPKNPMLGALANNGGPTFTHAPLTGSTAVEAGDNAAAANVGLTTDQRGAGFPRVADSADADTTATVEIGAFELHPSIEHIGTQTTGQDTPKSVFFHLGDDTAMLIATVTATSSNTTLVPNASLHLSGSGGLRILQMTPAASQTGMTTITITVTATNGRMATDSFVLTVAVINNPPSGTDNTVSTPQNTAYTFAAADFGFTDPNDTPPNTLLAVKITKLPDAGTLTKSNVAVNAGEFIPVADINGGLLKFTPATNEVGNPYTDFTFQVQDNGGGTDLDPTPKTMTINVTPPTSLIVTKVDDTNGTCLPGDCSLREAIAAANLFPDANVITFSSLFNTPQTATLGSSGGELMITQPVTIQGTGPQLLTVKPANSRAFEVSVGVGPVIISGLTVTSGNAGSGNGGGIFNNGGDLELHNVSITANTATLGGGIANFGTLLIEGSCITANRANDLTGNSSEGGGLYAAGGTTTIVNSTISGNHASGSGGAGRGGGIAAGSGTVNLINTTIAYNTAFTESAERAGGIFISSASPVFNLRNTLVSENECNSVLHDIDGVLGGFTVNSLGHNLVRAVGSGHGLTDGVMGDIVGHDPLLAILADNGGNTKTNALLPGSPAIDAGDNCVLTATCSGPNPTVVVDQRGIARPQGTTVDIGAYEFVPPFIVTKTEDTDNTCVPGDCSLREAIKAANAFPDANVINFAPLFNSPQTIHIGPGNGTGTELAITAPVTINGPGAQLLTIDGGNAVRIFSISDSSGPVVINDLKMNEGKVANGNGGAINNAGDLSLYRVGIMDSTAAQGGGIYNSGNLSIDRSYLFGNVADPPDINSPVAAHGGGLFVAFGIVEIVNSTIAENGARGTPGHGGGIYANGGAVDLVNVTIGPNFATTDGAGIFADGPSDSVEFHIRNTLIGNNRSGSNPDDDVAASDGAAYMFNSLGHNLVEHVTSGGGFGVTGDILGMDPLLGSMADNGGNTLTAALLLGSPAINGGDNCVVNDSCQSGRSATVNVDQRGIARPFGPAVDIGAYEYNVVNNPPAGTDKTVGTAQNTAYTFSRDDFGFTDPNDMPPNTLLAVKITTLPAAGTLTKNGAAVNLGEFISAADIDAGRLEFTPATDGLGNPYTSFMFQVQDDGGSGGGGSDLDPTPNTMSINVNVIPPMSLIVTKVDDTNGTCLPGNCSLREAIAAANLFPDANEINFAPLFNSPQTINIGPGNGTGTELAITAPVTINGPGAQLLTIDGGNAVRIFSISDSAGSVVIHDLTMSHGKVANGNGGAINNAGDLSLYRVGITDSVAAQGGGIYNSGNLSIDRSYLLHNAAEPPDLNNPVAAHGGGLYVALGSAPFFGFVDIVNSTIWENTAGGTPGLGGGIYANGGSVDLFNVTIGQNFAQTDGGGIFADGPSDIVEFNIRNTLIGNNHDGSGPDDDDDVAASDGAAYTFNSLGHNLVKHVTSGGGFGVTGDILGMNPLLGSLADNGGDTLTAALLLGSPAINAGDNCVVNDSCPGPSATVDVDQRGITRPFGPAVDIGAYEYNVVNNPPAGTDKTVGTAQNTAYTFATADFGFTDPNDSPPNTLLAVKITTLPAAGTLTNNHVAVNLGDFISAADIDFGSLEFTPAANALGNPYTSFMFQVQDDGGSGGGGTDLDPTPNTMSINVNVIPPTSLIVTKVDDTNGTCLPGNCSLREAIAAANLFPDANVITFAQLFDSPQTINISPGIGTGTELAITASVTITGPGARLLTINGGNAVRIFSISAGSVVINDLTMSGGKAGNGGAINNAGDLELNRVGITDSGAAQGGGIYSSGLLLLNASALLHNAANPPDLNSPVAAHGGGLYVTAGIVHIVNSTIAENNAGGTPGHGGGIYANGGTVDLVNVTIGQNTAQTDGGGIFADGPSDSVEFNIRNTLIGNNHAGSNPVDDDVAASGGDLYTFTSLGHNLVEQVTSGGGFGVTGDILGMDPLLGSLADNGGNTLTAALLINSPAINAGDNCVLNDMCPSGQSATVNVDQRGIARPFGPTVDIGAYEYNLVNNPPAGTDNTVTTAEDTAYTFATADFGFTDPNDSPPNALLAVKITMLPVLGTLTNNNMAVNVDDFIPVANINGGQLKFTPVADGFGTPYTSFTFQVQDNGGGTDLDPTPNTMTINVTAVNDPPSFTIAANPPSILQDAGVQTVINFATNISPGPNEAGQVLTFNVSATGSTGTLTFLSAPALNATTGTLTYTANNGTSGTATFSVTLTDNGSNTPPNSNTSPAQSFTITVTPNATPVVTTTAGNLAYTEGGLATAIDPGITLTDSDSTDLTGATVSITAGFVSAQDTLAFTNQLGITGNYNSGTGVLTLTGTATVANYQTALRSVTYQNSSDNPTASRTITFSATDGVTIGSATRGIAITAVNDAPVNAVPGPQSTNEDTAKVFSSGNGNQISVADVDLGANPIKITLTATNGTLTLSTIAGLSFTTGTGTNDATMVFTGMLSAVNMALNGMSFNPTPDFNGAASLQIVSDDQGSTGTGGALTDTDSVNITVNAASDAPVVTATGGNLAYTENAGATAIDPGLTVTNIDSTNLVGATVAITAGFVSAQDTLAFTNQLGITGSYNSGTGVLTLTGTTTVANYQTALRSVTYQNSSDNPSSSRTVTLTADNGTTTGSASRGITINAVNDAPVDAVPGPQSTNQNTPLVFSSGNGNQISVADVDAGSSAIRVTLTATNGTLTLNSTSGLAFTVGDGTADATMTFTGTIANINTALNSMVFTPTMGFSGAASLTITTNDQSNTGSGGPLTDTDVVNIQVSTTNISIQDAQVVEPTSGSVNMIFTVTLSAPAPAGGVSVSFTTQDEAPALSHATAGEDYTATTGTVMFASGEQVKTISVPVLSDNNMAETNETFLVVLSSPVNGQIADSLATGTILISDQPGAVLISELRTSGPAGAGDDFVEIYNNSNSPHTVNGSSGGYGLFKMGADCSATPVLIGVIPNGTVIPARGHYLFVGSAYSLANYGGSGDAAGDQTLSSDIENDRNVALFSTASLLAISTATRLDGVGFGSNTGGSCDLLREGPTLTPLSGSVLEHSYVRDECGKKGNPAVFGPCPTGGFVADTNVNNADFIFIDTSAASTPAGQRLGAPGPQNLSSPGLKLLIPTLLLDATKGAGIPPNRVRDTTTQMPNAMNGTMSVRRRFVNNTGAPVTRLRFRIVDIASTAVPAGIADLRALTSTDVIVTDITDSDTCLASTGSATTPCTVTVFGTTLEMPPAQAMGGAHNSTLSAGTITLAAPLAPGASINLQFLLGVQQTGSFKFFFNVEALP